MWAFLICWHFREFWWVSEETTSCCVSSTPSFAPRAHTFTYSLWIQLLYQWKPTHTHAHTHIHIHTLAAIHHFGLFLRETQIPLRKIDKTQRCDTTHGEKETPESRWQPHSRWIVSIKANTKAQTQTAPPQNEKRGEKFETREGGWEEVRRRGGEGHFKWFSDIERKTRRCGAAALIQFFTYEFS